MLHLRQPFSDSLLLLFGNTMICVVLLGDIKTSSCIGRLQEPHCIFFSPRYAHTSACQQLWSLTMYPILSHSILNSLPWI